MSSASEIRNEVGLRGEPSLMCSVHSLSNGRYDARTGHLEMLGERKGQTPHLPAGLGRPETFLP